MSELRKRKKGIDKELIYCLLVLFFPTLQFCIFYIGVNFNSILLSFKTYDTLSGKYYFDGFVNFERVWEELAHSSILKDALFNSLIVWLFGTILGITFAVFFAYYIYKKAVLGKAFKIVLFLPTVLPGVLCVVMFRYFVNEEIPNLYMLVLKEELVGLLVNQDTRLATAIF